MNIESLISHDIPVLVADCTVAKALEIMKENSITGLPVVSGDNYVAIAVEDKLLDVDITATLQSQESLLEQRAAVIAGAHPFDAIQIMYHSNLPLLPVTDNEKKYIGCITREGLLSYVAEHTGINTPGGVIVLEVLPRDYSMFEIARICENEDFIITNMQSRTNDRGVLEITLKLNRTILDSIVTAFERYDYTVSEVYGNHNNNNNDIVSNYNLLMNFINM